MKQQNHTTVQRMERRDNNMTSKHLIPGHLPFFSGFYGGWCQITIVVALVMVFTGFGGTASAAELRLEPALVQGPDACGECHKGSVTAWKLSHHATTFSSLPKSKDAKKIAQAMGIKRIKAESDCLSCHFTSGIKKEKVKPIAGITCESCHGAGKDWIKTHSDFGGKGVTKETETPDHKIQRYEQSVAAGMIRPSDLYAVANNCFECHTVPNEKLVNIGGHTAGSKFDLVAWSQGEVRHNVWYTKPNDEASQNRKRMMHIVGTMLDLEHALRGVAQATEKAAFSDAMIKRASSAADAIVKIASVVDSPEINTIVAISKNAALDLNNAAPLNEAADKIGAEARKFADSNDGSSFAGVDPMIAGADTFKGKPAP